MIAIALDIAVAMAGTAVCWSFADITATGHVVPGEPDGLHAHHRIARSCKVNIRAINKCMRGEKSAHERTAAVGSITPMPAATEATNNAGNRKREKKDQRPSINAQASKHQSLRKRTDSTSACFIEAGLSSSGRSSAGITDASSVTAPVTTGDATEVPESERQPPFAFEPWTLEPYL